MQESVVVCSNGGARDPGLGVHTGSFSDSHSSMQATRNSGCNSDGGHPEGLGEVAPREMGGSTLVAGHAASFSAPDAPVIQSSAAQKTSPALRSVLHSADTSHPPAAENPQRLNPPNVNSSMSPGGGLGCQGKRNRDCEGHATGSAWAHDVSARAGDEPSRSKSARVELEPASETEQGGGVASSVPERDPVASQTGLASATVVANDTLGQPSQDPALHQPSGTAPQPCTVSVDELDLQRLEAHMERTIAAFAVPVARPRLHVIKWEGEPVDVYNAPASTDRPCPEGMPSLLPSPLLAEPWLFSWFQLGSWRPTNWEIISRVHASVHYLRRMT